MVVVELAHLDLCQMFWGEFCQHQQLLTGIVLFRKKDADKRR